MISTINLRLILCVYLAISTLTIPESSAVFKMNDSIVQSATNNTLGKSVHLDGIAKDVQHLIAAELAQTSKSSVFALGQSSQTLRQATLPFIYRDIVLVKDEENDSSTKAYEALVDQFRVEGEYTVARYVRSIVVKDGASMNDLLMILDKISECGTLRKMRWGHLNRHCKNDWLIWTVGRLLHTSRHQYSTNYIQLGRSLNCRYVFSTAYTPDMSDIAKWMNSSFPLPS
jgi:hypothetical protein